MIANRAFMAALTPEEKEVIDRNIERLPIKTAKDDSFFSWWQIAETPEVLAINDIVSRRTK